MKVHIDKIGSEGYDLDEELSEVWLSEALGARAPFRPESAGRMVAHLERINDTVHVRGTVHVTVSADCSRCLSKALLVLDAPLAVTLFPAGEEPMADEEGELPTEAMGVSTYENEEIDLSNVVRDEVFLELPMTPLCAESCAGLCSMCGANLNEESCGCEKPIDPRWSALQHWKKQD